MTTHDPKAFDPLLLANLAIPADRLRTICRQLAPAYERQVIIPVLGTVLIEAGKTGTTFRLTDLDLQITVTADDLTCAAPFKSCVPFGLLRSCAATFDGVIQISHTPGKPGTGGAPDRLTLATDDGCNATINLLCPPEDFPNWVSPDDGWTRLEAAPADLRRLFTLARPCISTEETRYYLNGVFLCQKPDGTTLRAVATDGHRMAVIDGPIAFGGGITAILPMPLVGAILSVIDAKANEPVALMLVGPETPRARIIAGPVRIDARLIDGMFPNYLRVIPQADPTLSITVNAIALRRLTPFATQRSNAVRFSEGRASLDTPDREGSISLPVTMTALSDGSPMDMATSEKFGEVMLSKAFGYNLSYLLAQSRLTPTFRMDVTSPNDPARVYGEDPDAMWLIMPMRM